jgi:YhcN/YlaJ family sporulation lipoprotein
MCLDAFESWFFVLSLCLISNGYSSWRMNMRHNIHNNSENKKDRGGKMDYKRMKTSKTILTTIILLTVIAAGCANRGNQSDQRTRSSQATPGARNPVQQRSAPTAPADRKPIQRLAVPVENRIAIAKQAADNIAQLPGVHTANVLVTRQNAYVAAVLTANNPLSSEMENRIAQRVRATDPTVKNVYVSTNPDFVNRVNMYVRDVGQGRPISGFFEEFSRIIQRVFPQPR